MQLDWSAGHHMILKTNAEEVERHQEVKIEFHEYTDNRKSHIATKFTPAQENHFEVHRIVLKFPQNYSV
tara:strand:+ start:6447 stop:6653 length:207 start_codon:yes stop_codon:yes gene_type:complete